MEDSFTKKELEDYKCRLYQSESYKLWVIKLKTSKAKIKC